VLLIDGVCKLVNVVIPDLTQVNLVSRAIFFSWGYDNNFILGEKWSLSRLVSNGHVFPSICEGFQMSTFIGGRIFSSMCQYGVRNEGH
jgi:hypothetical protein